MEFKIISKDIGKSNITFNDDELKKELEEKLQKYKGLKYTEDEIKLAKSDRATLNNFKKAVDAKRLEIKKQCMVPYDKFEIKVKEILNMINAPVLEIDNQIKVFEEKTKTEKKAAIIAIYKELIGDLKQLLPFDKIYELKWMNATVKLPAITKDITDIIENAKKDLALISDFESEFETEIKQRYLDTLLLTEALMLKTKLEDKKKKLEEYDKAQKEKEEEAKKKAEAIKAEEKKNSNVGEVTCSGTGTTKTEPFIRPEPTPELVREVVPEAIIKNYDYIDVRIYVNNEQKLTLKKFLVDNGIKYGKVE